MSKPNLPPPSFYQKHEDVCGTEVGPPTPFWNQAAVEEAVRQALAAQVPGADEQDKTAISQFLTDVMTAAGLVAHGKQCKALAERLGKACMDLRLSTLMTSAAGSKESRLRRALAAASNQIDTLGGISKSYRGVLASDEPERILFPTYLRKMWSGGEVQAWLDELQGVTAPKPSAKGSLERYRKWQADQANDQEPRDG